MIGSPARHAWMTRPAHFASRRPRACLCNQQRLRPASLIRSAGPAPSRPPLGSRSSGARPGTVLPVPGAHPPQCALAAAWFRAADGAPVPDPVDVELVGVLGRDDRRHLVVGALEGGLEREEAEAAADAVDVDVD